MRATEREEEQLLDLAREAKPPPVVLLNAVTSIGWRDFRIIPILWPVVSGNSREFRWSAWTENQVQPPGEEGIAGDLTAMTCGRIGPNEMTDPASDIRYHSTGGRRNGEYELLDRSSFPSITLTLKSGLIVGLPTYVSLPIMRPSSNKDHAPTIFAILFVLLYFIDMYIRPWIWTSTDDWYFNRSIPFESENSFERFPSDLWRVIVLY